MKTFILAFLLILATFFPILFIPLLALTLVVLLIFAPKVLHHGMWSQPEK